MRRKATYTILALQLVLGAAAAAQGGVRALFPARPEGYVTDAAQVVSPEHARAITVTIQRLRELTGAEIAVVTLPTIGDYAAVDVAVAIGRDWGVGADAAVGDQRRNAGLTILLVPRREGDPNSGQIFLATGRGLEGIMPDAAAGRIRDRMRPQLAAGEYGAGLLTGVNAAAAVIAQGFGVTDSTLAAGGAALYRRGAEPGPLVVLIPLIVFVLVVAVAVAAGRSLGPGHRRRRGRWPRGPRGPNIFLGGPGWGGGFGGSGGGFGGGGFGGFGGGGGFSGGGAGGRF